MAIKQTQSLLALGLACFIFSSSSWAGYIRISRNIFEFSETFKRDRSLGETAQIYVQSSHDLSSDDVVEEHDGMRLDRKELKVKGHRVIGIDFNGYSYVTLSDQPSCREFGCPTTRGVYYLKMNQAVRDIPGLVVSELEFAVEIPVTLRKGSWESFQEGDSIELEPTREGQEKFIRWYESRFKQVLTSFYAVRHVNILNFRIETQYLLETFAQRWWWGPQFKIEADQDQIRLKAPHMKMKLEADLE